MSAETTQRPDSPCPGAPSGEGSCPLAGDFGRFQKLESFGLVTGEVAHELNNTLAIILGHAEMAIDEAPADGPLALRLRDIRESVVRAATLCRSMLARVGRAAPVRIGVDLAELVGQVRQLLRVVVPRAVRVECQVAPGLPPLVGDPVRLRQILTSLIFHAVDELGGAPGPIRLEIEMDPARDRAPSIGIRVSVAECGMDAAGAPGLSPPIDPQKAKDRELEVAAVRSLVEAMAGTLQVSCVPGEGRSVAMRFPVFHPEAGRPISEEEDLLEGEPAWTASGTVLLADDEPELLLVGSAILAPTGLRVLTATDGQEAVERFRQNAGEIGLVFLDAEMPRLNGCDALGLIREIDPDVRVVMISGHTEFDLAHRWIGARPPDDILLKPVSARELRRAAMRHLAIREPSLA